MRIYTPTYKHAYAHSQTNKQVYTYKQICIHTQRETNTHIGFIHEFYLFYIEMSQTALHCITDPAGQLYLYIKTLSSNCKPYITMLFGWC